MSPAPSGTVRITVVPSVACHFCDDADRTLAELTATFAFVVERVPVDSPEGRRLVALHRPALAPLVLVDGEFFSSGRLPRKKLTRLLAGRGVQADEAPGSRAAAGAVAAGTAHDGR